MKRNFESQYIIYKLCLERLKEELQIEVWKKFEKTLNDKQLMLLRQLHNISSKFMLDQTFSKNNTPAFIYYWIEIQKSE